MTDARYQAVALDRIFGFIVGRYLCGCRGKDLLRGIPEGWRRHPRWFEATRLAAALSSRTRTARATALAQQLAGVMQELNSRELS